MRINLRRMKQRANRVLVFGDDSRSFLAVIRSFGRKGIEVHAVPFGAPSPALKSRYVSKIHRLPEYDGSARWISALERILKSHEFDLLVPCCDGAILCLDAYRERLAQIRMALPNRAVMEWLFDKQKTRALAQELGVPTARGRPLTSSDTADGLVREFGLPLLLKTRRSYRLKHLDRRGQVHLIRSLPELERVLKDITPEDNLAEAYFAGRGSGVSVVASEGEILCAFQHRRLEDPVGGGGSSLRIGEKPDEKLLAACRAIAARCAMTGVAMFEFRAGEDGSFVLIEVNARFWGSLPLAIASGVDFPWLLYIAQVYGKRPGQVNYREGIVARNFVLNAEHVLFHSEPMRGGGVRRVLSGIAGLLVHPIRLLAGREVSDTFQRDDLIPAIWEIASIPARLLRRTMPRFKRSGRAHGGTDAKTPDDVERELPGCFQ
jgi:predicted ATP-grasp superfamily ATP-dependent carboligase